MCIDAATRIVGCFVTIKGMGLIFLGITEAIRDYVLELDGDALTGIFILQNLKGRRL
jgi:hypothetical protein